MYMDGPESTFGCIFHSRVSFYTYFCLYNAEIDNIRDKSYTLFNLILFIKCFLFFRTAARLIIQVPRRAPVSGVMRDVLHWLSFPQRVTFKLCLLTYKCLHGLAPQYLSQCCIPLAAVPGRSQLRSADEGHLLVHRTSTSTLGPRAFYSSGPASWNSLPTALRHLDLTLGVFKRQLKTVLFSWM